MGDWILFRGLGELDVAKTRLNVDWSREVKIEDLEPALKKIRRHLEKSGLRKSTIESYLFRIEKYLEFAKTDAPSADDFAEFCEMLYDKRLSRSSINNYCFAIRKYYEMRGLSLDFPFVKPMNTIPHFFDENDIDRLFGACHNLKHLAMLQTLFYGCLRASELCNIDDSDLDLKSLTLQVEGKGGKEAIV